MPHEFAYGMNTPVKITESGEAGTVIGRAQFAHSEESYLIRYRSADGRAVETWWGSSAIAAT